ncbi:hypothetical protein [Pontibacter qinzhouensis]|nr:hypothetical protein [Pontibacter qinzhouensis]
MLLHINNVIQMRYSASADVLTVKWPDVRGVAVPELRYAFEMMGDVLRHYDIKKLLIDSSSNATEIVPTAYLQLMEELLGTFTATRLQKVARLSASNSAKEAILTFYTSLVAGKKLKGILFSNFYVKKEAITWLTNN